MGTDRWVRGWSWSCRPMVAVRLVLLGFTVTGDVLAYEARVDAESTLQLYTVRGPYGQPVLSRQRMNYQLGLEVRTAPRWQSRPGAVWAVHARLRLDGDFGIRAVETNPAEAAEYVPGLDPVPLDLSYGYVEGTGLFRRTTNLRLGRQLVSDSLGWWSFDGARVGFAPGGWFEIYALAGAEQRGGVPWLSTPRYEADGVTRGDRTGLDEATWPGYLSSREPAWAVGSGLQLTALDWLRARVDYRRVLQQDTVVTTPFADVEGNVTTYSGRRLSSERLGVDADVEFSELGWFSTGTCYDQVRELVSDQRGTLGANLGKQIQVSAGYDYQIPVFDADSIFNWFGPAPSLLFGSDLTVRPSSRVAVSTHLGRRWVGIHLGDASTDAEEQADVTGADWLWGVQTTFKMSHAELLLSQRVETGDLGSLAFSELSYLHRFAQDRWEVLLLSQLGTLADFDGEPGIATVGTVVGLRGTPRSNPRYGVECEHSTGTHVDHRFRVVGTLEVAWP